VFASNPESVSQITDAYEVDQGYTRDFDAILITNGAHKGICKFQVEITRRAIVGRTKIALDYGCGFGALLNVLSESCFEESYGIEISNLCHLFVKRFYGMDLLRTLDELRAHTTEPLDAIFMNTVLEHLPNFQQVLADLVRELRPGGCITVMVPNWNRERLSLRRYIWPHTGHLWHFTPKSLGLLFRKYGLQVVYSSRLPRQAQTASILGYEAVRLFGYVVPFGDLIYVGSKA